MTVRELASGARAMLPWLAGVAPFGLVIGVAAAQADIATGAGWFTGPTIYGGSLVVVGIEVFYLALYLALAWLAARERPP